MRYPYEVREASAYFDEIADVKVPGEMLKLAERILDGKTGDFDPSTFEDRYETAVVEMLKAKQAGMPVRTEAAAPAPSTVITVIVGSREELDPTPRRSLGDNHEQLCTEGGRPSPIGPRRDSTRRTVRPNLCGATGVCLDG